jgi:alpha-D-ribose 1-methylphosphonate 5-phosphate C-P lyase
MLDAVRKRGIANMNKNYNNASGRGLETGDQAQLLMAVAIPGYRFQFGSRELAIGLGWAPAGFSLPSR